LNGAFDGAFVVRQSLSNEQLLWLHYVAGGRVCHLSIHNNTEVGLSVQGSSQEYAVLSQLINEYAKNPNNDVGLHISFGWETFQTSESPPIDKYDHLTAPWFFENMTRDQANAQLDYHPSGTFVCPLLVYGFCLADTL
jgi:hypothetical protein